MSGARGIVLGTILWADDLTGESVGNGVSIHDSLGLMAYHNVWSDQLKLLPLQPRSTHPLACSVFLFHRDVAAATESVCLENLNVVAVPPECCVESTLASAAH